MPQKFIHYLTTKVTNCQPLVPCYWYRDSSGKIWWYEVNPHPVAVQFAKLIGHWEFEQR